MYLLSVVPYIFLVFSIILIGIMDYFLTNKLRFSYNVEQIIVSVPLTLLEIATLILVFIYFFHIESKFRNPMRYLKLKNDDDELPEFVPV